MTGLLETNGRPSAEGIESLRRTYGFDRLTVGDRLEGGYANDVFHATGDGRRLVLRVKPPPVDFEDLVWEHQLVRRLADRLAEVQAPVPAIDGAGWVELGDRAACLLPFVEASAADARRGEHREAAARALGRLHAAGAGLDVPARPRLRALAEIEWPDPHVPEELREWAGAIEAERRWAVAYVAELARSRALDASLVHGDFFPGNVLVAGVDAVAVLDWEEAHVDWVAWDLACAVGSFCGGPALGSLDRDAAARFVLVYREAGGTALPGDDDVLVPLVRVKRILEVLRAPADRHPLWDEQRWKLRSLATLDR